MRLLYTILAAIFLTVMSLSANAQAFLETEYIFPSSYRDVDNKRVGEGDAKIIKGGIQLPVSVDQDKEKGLRAWSVALGGSYASFNNSSLSEEIAISEIFNGQVGLLHNRTLNDKWSLLATVGAGIYLDHHDLSEARFDNVLAQGGVVFIRHLLPNLDLGGGLAFNNTFGYPMAFPAVYLNWRLEKEYQVYVSIMDSFEVLAGKKLNENLVLNLSGEANGMLALVERNGKDVMFTHQHMTGGIQSKFVINKSLSIPVTLGISAYRPAYYANRTIKDFFNTMGRDHDPHFAIAPYISASIEYGL